MYRPLQGVTRENITRELFAGVTLLAISVPLNIGYAQIAGLPATAGLYALIVPTIVYALTVSSQQVVASPDAAAAALVFSSLTGLSVGGENFAAMAAAQALLSGLMLFAAAFLKLGFLANFLSKPILIGFVGGLAMEILVSQFAKMLGVSLESGGEFFENVATLLGGLGATNLWSLGISAVAVLILLLGRRVLPVVPWALVVLVLASLATAVWKLEDRGVAVLGEVQAGAPQFAIPLLDFGTWVSLVPSALAMTLVTIAEGLLVSRSYAEKNGYRTTPNRDLFAFGAANVLAGLSSSFAMGSSTSRTAAMDGLRSRTQIPSLVVAGGTLLLLLFGTAVLAVIPSPAIGAVVAVAVIKLLGLGIAFLLSLINIARRAATPTVDILVGHDDPTLSLLGSRASARQTSPGLLVLRFAAPIFFANGAVLADRIASAVENAPTRIRAVVLDMEAVTDIDVTGSEAVDGVKAWLAQRGIALVYTRVRPELRSRLDRFGLLIGTSEFPTNREAAAALNRPGEES